MTREEAIRILKNFSLCGVYHQLIHMNDTDSEAISMAIKALEQPDLTADQIHTMKEQEYMRGYEDGRKAPIRPCDDGDELDGAIQNLEEIADEEDNIAYNLEPEQWMNIASCEKRAAYNRQLASWLRELKERMERDDT